MNRTTRLFRVHQHRSLRLVPPYSSMIKQHRFPVASAQSTQKQADNSLVLGGAVDDCKIAGSLVIAALPLSVKHTHASKLPRI